MEPYIIELISTLGDGGAETLVKDYAIMLNNQNVRTEILTIYDVKKSSNITLVRNANITISSILPGYSSLWRLFKYTIGFIYVPLKILFIVKSKKVSCIHVHMNQLHHITPIIGFIKGIKVLYTCHNTPSQYFKGFSRRMEYNAVAKLVKHDNFQLVALHETMAEELSSMFGISNVEIIRNGVNFHRFSNISKSKEEKRKELGINENAFVIGHVGRFSEQKNHRFLINVFRKIAKHKKNAFLLLIGSGDLKEEIVSLIHSYSLDSQYLILSHRSDIPELLKAMDVFLFPSVYEGLPVSLVEAQVSKLHCVISDRIDKSAVLLPTTKVLSLNDSIEKWSEECIRSVGEIEWNDKILSYDMNREIIKLIGLYK